MLDFKPCRKRSLVSFITQILSNSEFTRSRMWTPNGS
jgi:hypothetical protein